MGPCSVFGRLLLPPLFERDISLVGLMRLNHVDDEAVRHRPDLTNEGAEAACPGETSRRGLRDGP